MSSSKVIVKIATASKTKRLMDVPASFSALKTAVEGLFEPESLFTIRYTDGQQDEINVSDDEDLLTAYEVAHKEL